MLIVALVLAVISLAALVTAVVTSNELIAWACIGFSALGVLLLVADAIRDRNRRPVRARADAALAAETTEVMAPVAVNDVEEKYSEATDDAETYEIETVEDYPDEVVYDDPDHDLPDDDEPSYPVPAEEAAVHIITDEELDAQADSDEAAYNVETTVERDESGSYTVIYSGETGPDESLETTVSDESSETTVSDESSETTVSDESSDAVPGESSAIVTESPTVSYADSQSDTDDSIVVIYSSEHSEEERGGER